jgi:hypothetical protein
MSSATMYGGSSKKLKNTTTVLISSTIQLKSVYNRGIYRPMAAFKWPSYRTIAGAH